MRQNSKKPNGRTESSANVGIKYLLLYPGTEEKKWIVKNGQGWYYHDNNVRLIQEKHEKDYAAMIAQRSAISHQIKNEHITLDEHHASYLAYQNHSCAKSLDDSGLNEMKISYIEEVDLCYKETLSDNDSEEELTSKQSSFLSNVTLTRFYTEGDLIAQCVKNSNMLPLQKLEKIVELL